MVPGLFLFPSALWQTNSAVLARRGEALVVDPGYFPAEVQAIRDFVAEQGFSPALFFTHGDFDHVVGHQAFPEAPRWGSRAMLGRDGKAVERQVADFDARFYVERPSPFTFPTLDRTVGEAPVRAAGLAPATPEQSGTARLADLELLFFSAPGHTEDGLILVVPDLKLMFAGDYLSDLEFPFVEHSLAAYRQTLRRFRRLTDEFDLERLVPGHGPAAATRQEILSRIAQDEAYLERLWDAALAGVRRGAEAHELRRLLEDVPYRGRPVPPHLRRNHTDNVERVLVEVRAPGRTAPAQPAPDPGA